MKKRKAISAIGILLTLLITALLFLYFVRDFINKNDVKNKAPNQEQVYKSQELEQKLDELQNLRQETQQAEQNKINALKDNF